MVHQAQSCSKFVTCQILRPAIGDWDYVASWSAICAAVETLQSDSAFLQEHAGSAGVTYFIYCV